MKITKEMLDKKVKDFEDDCNHDLTFREFIIELEDLFKLKHENLDEMTDDELDDYDSWLWHLTVLCKELEND